ncbi:MAG TPA: hypothetical protein VIY08_06230, partial [Candidatus Nitrosocosmicus sp.]
GKKFNRCKIYHNPYEKDPKKRTYCKCDLQELTDFSKCKYCNKDCCEKCTLARYGEDPEKYDPFTWGKLLVGREKSGHNQYSKLTDIMLEEREQARNAAKDLRKESGMNDDEIIDIYSETLHLCKDVKGIREVAKSMRAISKKNKPIWKENRWWRPVTFYFYGPGDSGKSGIVTELFRHELYDKPKKQKRGSNWWNGYKGQEIILLDEIYTKIEWGDMVNVLNDTANEVEQKNKGFVPLIAKYVFMTGNRPPSEVYTFSADEDYKNHQDYNQFERRLDYIIEWSGKWNDDINLRTSKFKVHKGDEESFRNMTWDLKYCKGEFTCAEAKEMVEELNKDIPGETIIRNNQVYWRRKFPEFKINYLRDYPRCRELSDYKQELLDVQNNKRTHDQIDNDNGELIDYRPIKKVRDNDIIDIDQLIIQSDHEFTSTVNIDSDEERYFANDLLSDEDLDNSIEDDE